MIYREVIEFETGGENDYIDITHRVEDIVKRSNIRNGLVNVFVVGSTAAITTMEYEPGLRKDLARALARIAPSDIEYEHHKRWGDDNGRSHVKASIVGPSLIIPVENGRLLLGTWQQIVFLELDTRPRRRRVVVTVMGEE
ncbi:MAG: secondary thiamine-phosphate synthase enzyme YjbQ [Candidatus Njordarchaeales archaeon]